jgi:hypothetical protein
VYAARIQRPLTRVIVFYVVRCKSCVNTSRSIARTPSTLQKLRWNKDFLRIPILRAKRTRNVKMHPRAPNFIAMTGATRLCTQQKIFAQFAAREGAKRVESIKNERISAG